MNRILVSLVIAEAVIIVLLAAQLLGREDHQARQPVQRGSTKPEEPASRPSKAREPANTSEQARASRQPGEAAGSVIEYVLLHGRISSSAGGPLKPPVWINLAKPGAKPNYTQLQPEGYYSFAGVAPGIYKLKVSGPAYDEAEVELTLAAGVTRRDLELVAAMEIRIRIRTPEGKPLVEALAGRKIHLFGGIVAVATRDPVERLPLTELRSHSRYGLGNFRTAWEMQMGNKPKLPKGVVGVLMVKAAPPFHVSAAFMHMVLATRKVTAPVEELTFVIRADEIENRLATVKLRLLDAESGAPVKGRVSISDRQSGGSGLMADEQGKVRYPKVPPGLKEFQIWAKDYEAVHTYIRVTEGGELDLGTLRLHKAVEISGRVVDSDGKPVATSMLMRNLDRMKFPQPLSHAMSYRSDTEGKFKFSGIGRGRILIGAAYKGHAIARVVVDTSGGGLDNVLIKLEKGTDVALEPEPNRSRDYFVTIRRDGVPYVTRFVRRSWPIKASLAPGRYTIEIAEDGEVRRTIPLDVGKEPIVRSISAG